ncbi:MAG: DNA mismatch repair endonuclease MutL [Flavobacteriaceae bacterium]|nr:DNA mismatch repair endonuclease MutL [Flavobacteriaceae bacterium]
MADIIKLLPDHVANQIAAGEVVQRPASVVKELLENAIDAKASIITLVVKNAGKTLVQVIDNGKGMSDTDARFCFERHATSKISSAEDLFALHTKGFRGEALASIAAIAHVELYTKEAQNDVGVKIAIEGSTVKSQDITVVPNGTSVSVKNLFFNIPARRKFLKSDKVELRHILDEFHRIVLAHPDIAFHLINNGTELFNLPASNLRQRIVNVFGGKTNTKLVPVEEDTEVVKLHGFVCKPDFAKKSRGEQYFFVNNRYIRSPYLHHSVMAAFEGLVPDQHHPGYYLYLEVDPNTIDINIHPTKTEVKFDDEHALYAILRSSIKHSLGQFQVAPVLDFDTDPNLDTPYHFKDKEVHIPKVEVDHNYNPFAEEVSRSSAVKNNTMYTKATSGASWEGLYAGIPETVRKIESDFGNIQIESDVENVDLFENQMQQEATPSFQLKRKYIVTPIKSGLVIIDQYRAHQRVLYERFLKNITVEKGASQQLLFPLNMSFSSPDIAILQDIRDSLEQVGFMFDRVEGDMVSVRGVPIMVNESEVQLVLEQIVQEVNDFGSEDAFSQSDLLAKALCKSLAVRSGSVLQLEAQEALINDLFACKDPMVSPFQKPIYITTPIADLDKKFM